MTTPRTSEILPPNSTHGPGTAHEAFKVGDTFARAGTVVTILRSGEATQDRFGRAMTRYWCMRADTGAEGFMTYGPGGVVSDA